MKIRPWIIILLLLAGFWTVQGPFVSGAEAMGKPPIRVALLFFNDIHGHLTPFKIKTDTGKMEVGGIARMAAVVKRIRSENRRKGIQTYLLFAGDMLQGTPMSTVFKGKPDILCFNAMGVNAMTVGNHEFDFGLDNFKAVREAAGFPFLSSNIVWKDNGQQVCDPSIAFEIGPNLYLNVIGVTTRDLLITTKPENVVALKALDPLTAVLETIKNNTKRGPIVLLSHCRHKTDRRIATAIPELTAIIGGHDQVLLNPFRRVGDVPVFQAFEKGKYLGRLDLQIDPVSGHAEMLDSSYISILEGMAEDEAVAGIVKRFYDRLDNRFKAVIGNAAVFLDGERERVRYEETNLGNFITDIMRAYTGAQIAFVNAGSIRASIDEGPIMLEEVFKTMPYANEIVKIQLTGAEIMTALRRAVRGQRDDEDGGFLHVSGIRIQIRQQSVEAVVVGADAKRLDPETTYAVAITDFLSSGGDGYDVFMGKPTEKTGLPLRELIVDTIRAGGVVNAVADGRITRLAP
jgi:2',3'-cyclic-nucleotide 2'-phosphodiesterase (5'-nucleotidase family)